MPRKSSRNIQNQLSNDDCETNRCFVRQVGKHLRLQPGDTLWTKVNGCPWWPAQVVNDKRISNRFKRKAEGEVLVRLYGTYEYISVDPVKSHSEFANKLKQENSKKHEVFQKALEEVLSHAKAGCNSKRKVSRCSEIVASVDSKIKRQKTSGNSMGKRREQHVVERSQENQSPASPEAQTDNVKESKSVRQRRGKSKAEAIGDNKSRKYDLRKTKDREQKNVSMEKDQKNTKVDVVCMKSGENATATKENTASKASRGKKAEKISTNNDDADGLAIPETRSREAAEKESSAIPNKRGKALQENKTKKDEVKKRKAREVSENNIIEANVSKKPKLARRLRDRTSDAKTAIQDVVNPAVKKKSNAKACNGKLTKKAKNEAVDVKSSKQNIATPPKETLRTKIPISKVAEAEEESMSIKMKVMQSLGLIAPSGSPFKRNLVTKGGRRIF